MRTIFILCTVLLLSGAIQAQTCTPYYPIEEDTRYTLAHYDKKDELQSQTRYEVILTGETAWGYETTIKGEAYDEEDLLLQTFTFVLKCEDGVFYIDTRQAMPASVLQAYPTMELILEGDQLPFPANPEPGQELEEGTLEIGVENDGIRMVTIVLNFTDRKIAAIDTVTTPAGTFACYKITYKQEMVTGKVIPVRTINYVTEWYAANTGVVRSELYSKKKKLESYSVLEEIERP